MFILVGLIILLIFSLIGFLIWSASDLPLAIREIAINSREDKVRGSAYNLLKTLSACIKITAILVWLVGAALSYAYAPSIGAMLDLLMKNAGI